MRTKTLFVSVLLLAALALSACAPAAASGQSSRTLNVSGVGRAYLTPDIAYIYVGVHTENASASRAMDENTSRTQEIIAALGKAGVEKKDIQTANFSIWTQDKYDPITGQSTGEKVYVIDNTVYVTVRQLDGLGDLLDTLVRAGANNINSIQFDVADKTAALKQARDEAVQNGKAQAQELADAAGLTLGDIVEISFYDSIPTPVMEAFGGKGGGEMAGSAVPIQPGQMLLAVNVQITYEIR